MTILFQTLSPVMQIKLNYVNNDNITFVFLRFGKNFWQKKRWVAMGAESKMENFSLLNIFLLPTNHSNIFF